MNTAVVDAPISETDLTVVYDIPGSLYYRVEATLLDGHNSETFETKAYTKDLLVDDGGIGHVSIEIGAKSRKVPQVKIPYPFHFLHDGVLFAFKRNRFEVGNQYALNYDLFCLSWDMSVIINFDDDGGRAFMASREEWNELGDVGHTERELQCFLGVGEHRSLPLVMVLNMADDDVKRWANECRAVETKRRG